jgi:thiol-disulfide isomerase/thioredoxin
MRKLTLLAWAATVSLVAACGSPVAPAEPEATAAQICQPAGEMADLNFTLKDMNGADVTLADYAGSVILLDFWATWCGPCKIEIPGFVELYDRYGPEGFIPLGSSVDDPVDRLHLFAEEFGMDYPVLVGDGRDDVKEAFGPLIGFPTTYVIARDGTVCAKHVGFAPREEFEAAIRALL